MDSGVKPNYGFEALRDNEGVVYSVQGMGGGCSTIFLKIVFGAMLSLCLSVPIATTLGTGDKQQAPIFVSAFIILNIIWIYIINEQRKMQTQTQSVRVEKSKLFILPDYNNHFDLTHVGDIILENSFNKQSFVHSSGSGIIVGGTGAIGAVAVGAVAMGNTAAKIGNAIGNASRAEEALRNWNIIIRYGSEYITIFTRLNKGVSEALFQDFVRTIEEFK